MKPVQSTYRRVQPVQNAVEHLLQGSPQIIILYRLSPMLMIKRIALLKAIHNLYIAHPSLRQHPILDFLYWTLLVLTASGGVETRIIRKVVLTANTGCVKSN